MSQKQKITRGCTILCLFIWQKIFFLQIHHSYIKNNINKKNEESKRPCKNKKQKKNKEAADRKNEKTESSEQTDHEKQKINYKLFRCFKQCFWLIYLYLVLEKTTDQFRAGKTPRTRFVPARRQADTVFKKQLSWTKLGNATKNWRAKQRSMRWNTKQCRNFSELLRNVCCLFSPRDWFSAVKSVFSTHVFHIKEPQY